MFPSTIPSLSYGVWGDNPIIGPRSVVRLKLVTCNSFVSPLGVECNICQKKKEVI